MTRPSQLLHAQREPAPLRPAATVLLLRDGTGPDGQPGTEVLMTRRSMSASFAPGAYVFPGGGIDAADAAAHGLARHRPQQDGTALTQAVAAIRESFEELGILLAYHADGRMADAGTVAALDLDADAALGRQPAPAYVAHEATRAVAAVLDLAAVGVVDDVFKVQTRRGRGAHGQNLVGPHAEVAVGQKAVLGGRESQGPGGFVEHDKIVARALHFGKGDLHAHDYPRNIMHP